MNPAHTGRRRAAPGLARAAVVAAFAALPLAVLAPPASAQPDDPEVPVVVLDKTYQPRDPDPAPGEVITYTVTLTNSTGADATGHEVTGEFPPEILEIAWTCTEHGAGSACGAASGTGAFHDIADIGAGGSVVYLITGTIAPDAEGTFVQAVTLVPGPGQGCAPVFAGTAPQPEQYPYEPPPGDGDEPGDGSYPPGDGDEPGDGSYPPGDGSYPPGDGDEPGDGETPGGGYGPPTGQEVLLCRVNNEVTPQALPVTPPESDGAPVVQQDAVVPVAPVTPTLPNTGAPALGYLGAGGGAILVGAALLWLTRRRPHEPGDAPAR